jgi:hypothetical protein
MRGRGGSIDTLDVRALNRALLARQHLLRRTRMTPAAAIEHLVGMQAQVPESPYLGLWARIEGFHHDDLTRLVRARRVVRIALMRSTIHLVTVRDCRTLRPLMQPAVERGLWTGNYGRSLARLDRDAIAAAGRAIVEEQPRTFSELIALLHRRWPNRDGHALAMAVRGLVPLVQVPPRGLWGHSGPAAHSTLEAWTGRTLNAQANPSKVMLRYLAVFGPSSIADMQAWSGLSGLREVIDPLKRRLRTFKDARGRELFDLPDAPRPHGDAAAPPRFLPEFDNLLLAHADRTRIVEDRHRRRLFAGAGLMLGTVLLDGFVGARWRLVREPRRAIVDIQSFKPLDNQTWAAVEIEAGRLLDCFAADGKSHDVRIGTLSDRRTLT